MTHAHLRLDVSLGLACLTQPAPTAPARSFSPLHRRHGKQWRSTTLAVASACPTASVPPPLGEKYTARCPVEDETVRLLSALSHRASGVTVTRP